MFEFMENKYESDGCDYTGYDIIGCFNDENIVFKDISRNRAEAEFFTNALNNSDVHKIHFFDIVYDFIISQAV